MSASPPTHSPKSDDDDHMFEDVVDLKTKYGESLAAVRSQLSLPCEDDVTVYRFLRGHKLDVKVAAQHLEATLKWRQENKLDEIREKAAKLTQKQYPHADKVLAVHPHCINHGFDKSGQPLSIERLGYANPSMMVRTVPFDEMVEYHFYHMEGKIDLVKKLTAETGKVIRTAKIMDLAGLGRHHLDRRGLAYFKKIIDTSQSNYPEMLGKLYVVNTPWLFSVGWKIVKPWLNEKTLSKIHILQGSDFLPQLEADIDRQYIPQFLGGDCTCGGTGCVPLVDPDANMTLQQIAARGKFEHTLTIDAEMIQQLRATVQVNADGTAPAFKGVTVSYEFRTKKNDIALEIHARKTNTNASQVLKPSQRYESDQETITGSLTVTDPSVLTFIFDNSFSYFTKKELLYRIDTEASISSNEEADQQIDEAMKSISIAQENKQ